MKQILFILSLILLSGCASFEADRQLEDALELAGNNRGELEKVLEHYEKDSLKLEAAKFLIRNMPGHFSYSDTSVVLRYSLAVDSVLRAMKGSCFKSLRDSINVCADRLGIANLKKVQDIRIITAQYLIRNIDAAFDDWRKGLWAQHLTFDEFCEYLLPYKVEELQLLDDWRFRLKKLQSKNMRELNRCDVYRNSTIAAARKIIRNSQDTIKPFIELVQTIRYPIMKWETRMKIPFGTCDHYSSIGMAILRSNGIPVASEVTPHWACRRLGHSWNILIAENGHNYPFNGITSFPGDNYLLMEKMAKAYRHTYSINQDLVDLNNAEKNVPNLFKTFFLKDVTDEYVNSISIDIKPNGLPKNRKYAFLAIFGDQDWTPISFGKVKKGKVHYQNLGRNILYMPFCYTDGGAVNSINEPFVVLPSGKTKKIKVNRKKRIQVVLKRKYPTLELAYQFLSRLDGCEFQASNDKKFRKYQIIHKIGEHYAFGYDVKVADSVPAYRYWRFFSTKAETHANIAELYFFDASGKEIKGKVIGTTSSWDGGKNSTRDAVADRNLITFFDAPDGDGSWVGIDFGKPVNISHFCFYSRGDGNSIELNNKYELFYWYKDKWNSLGVKKALSPTLLYNNVPYGGVYLLRNLTHGHEERIFTYEKGKQIWW